MKKFLSLITAMFFTCSMLATEVTVSKTVHDLYPNDANGTQETTLYSDSVLTISVNSDGNNGKVYGSGTEWRLYQTNTAVVTVGAVGATIKTVAFEFTIKNNAVLKFNESNMSSNVPVDVDTTSAQFTVGNSSSTTNGQVIIKGFTVTYDKDSSVIPLVDTTTQDTITPVDPTPIDESIMTPGENASAATVNDKYAVKVGTSKNAGTMTITVPSNAIRLTFYVAAWKGAINSTLNITPENKITVSSIDLSPDDGISNNSPFTLVGNEEDFKYVFDLIDITEQVTFTLTSPKRFVVWDASYEVRSDATAINDEVGILKKAVKFLRNGTLIIEKDNKTYNILGQCLK